MFHKRSQDPSDTTYEIECWRTKGGKPCVWKDTADGYGDAFTKQHEHDASVHKGGRSGIFRRR